MICCHEIPSINDGISCSLRSETSFLSETFFSLRKLSHFKKMPTKADISGTLWKEFPVSSSWIDKLAYDTKNYEGAMSTHGHTYTFPHMAGSTFKSWLASKSKGKFFNHNLRA